LEYRITTFLLEMAEAWRSSRDGRNNFIRNNLSDNSVKHAQVPVEFCDRVSIKLESALNPTLLLNWLRTFPLCQKLGRKKARK